MARLADRADAFVAAGVEVVVIGSGWPEMAAHFAERFEVPFQLLCDPELEAYRAAGLKRGVGTLLGRGALQAGRRAWQAGFRQGRTQGDPWQQGGVLVVATGGEPVWVQVSDYAGDHADEEALLAAAEEASQRS